MRRAHKLTLNRTAINILRNSLRTSSLDLAAHTVCRAKNLFNGTGKVLREGLEPHCSGDLDNVFEGNTLGVLDVLLLLPVTGGFLEGLDNQGGGCGYDGHGGLTVLDGEFDGNSQPFLRISLG